MIALYDAKRTSVYFHNDSRSLRSGAAWKFAGYSLTTVLLQFIYEFFVSPEIHVTFRLMRISMIDCLSMKLKHDLINWKRYSEYHVWIGHASQLSEPIKKKNRKLRSACFDHRVITKPLDYSNPLSPSFKIPNGIFFVYVLFLHFTGQETSISQLVLDICYKIKIISNNSKIYSFP